MIAVVTAPPFATIQDAGRFGFRDAGVPVSGIADLESGLALNAMLGNDRNAAMIEWAVAGGTIRFERDATVAIGGADAACSIGQTPLDAWEVVDLRAGDELHVDRLIRGRFLLVAVRGGLDVPLVLGSRSTLTVAAIGGLDGRRLRNGDRLPVGSMLGAATAAAIQSVSPPFREIDAPINVIRGPQASLFDDDAWATFCGTPFTVSRASDRAGYRLEGAAMRHGGSAAIASEPTCVGAIQIPDGGEPIVIMQDGPTVGGYPKIAVVRSASLSRFAQLAPGDTVRFVLDDM